MAAGIYAFGALFYLIFGSGELQSWALNESKPTVTVVSKEIAEPWEGEELVPKSVNNERLERISRTNKE